MTRRCALSMPGPLADTVLVATLEGSFLQVFSGKAPNYRYLDCETGSALQGTSASIPQPRPDNKGRPGQLPRSNLMPTQPFCHLDPAIAPPTPRDRRIGHWSSR